MSRTDTAKIGNDPASETASARLRDSMVAWMTTISPAGVPQTSPIWYLWDGDEFLMYSLESARVRNVEANPMVSLNLDGNKLGGDVVVVEGRAEVDRTLPPVPANPEYLAKYGPIMDKRDWSPEWFGSRYSAPIRIRPTRYRYW